MFPAVVMAIPGLVLVDLRLMIAGVVMSTCKVHGMILRAGVVTRAAARGIRRHERRAAEAGLGGDRLVHH